MFNENILYICTHINIPITAPWNQVSLQYMYLLPLRQGSPARIYLTDRQQLLGQPLLKLFRTLMKIKLYIWYIVQWAGEEVCSGHVFSLVGCSATKNPKGLDQLSLLIFLCSSYFFLSPQSLPLLPWAPVSLSQLLCGASQKSSMLDSFMQAYQSIINSVTDLFAYSIKYLQPNSRTHQKHHSP